MYIIKVYEEDCSGYKYVGKINGRFLTYEDAQVKIKNQNQWCQNKFFFRIEEVA